ncbi:MAG: glycosyltransferase family 4 protein [Bacteroidales bacterium]|jgi:glycosyltransferase involved in cell wall biosynthesis|nr:glycosyltransferase family 4 protein [Bacteroidales bacterium]
MRVLMFGWEFPPHIAGGLGTACFGLTKGMKKQGMDVIFVVPKAYGDESEEAVKIVNASDVSIDMRYSNLKEYFDNVTYIEVNSRLIPYVGTDDYFNIENQEKYYTENHDTLISHRKYEFSGKYGENTMLEVERYAMVAAQIAKDFEFDIIHAHDWLTYNAGIAAKKVSGKPLVVHMHATEFDRSGLDINTVVFDIERKGMMAADRVVTVSNYTRNIVVEKHGIPAEKVFTVHNAVEPNESQAVKEYKKNIDDKIVTFLGRVTFQKGPEYFVEAAHMILQRDPNVRFVLAGDGDMMPKVIRRVAQLRMGDRFNFTGFLRGAEVDKMFALSDVYVMPSVSEPFGISPLEAMRSNVPVVISKQSGVSEVLQHALKVDFWDVEAMADAIYGLLHYPALSDMFVEHGKIEVDNLLWENAAYKLKLIYNELI